MKDNILLDSINNETANNNIKKNLGKSGVNWAYIGLIIFTFFLAIALIISFIIIYFNKKDTSILNSKFAEFSSLVKKELIDLREENKKIKEEFQKKLIDLQEENKKMEEKYKKELTVLQVENKKMEEEFKKELIDLQEENKKMVEEFKEINVEFIQNMNETNKKIEDTKNKTESQIYKKIVGPIINGRYIVHSVSNPELVWDIEQPQTPEIDGNKLTVHQKHGETNQQFFFVYNPSDGTYTIYALHSRKAIDVDGASKNIGAKVQQYSPNNTGAQKWIINKEGNNNQYSFKNIATENYMDIKENHEIVSNPKNNKNSQKFTLELINPIIYW